MAVAALKREELQTVAAPERAPGKPRRGLRTGPLAKPRTSVRPAARPRTRPNTYLRPLGLLGVPVLLLVIYVGLWTHATARGYQRNQLRNRIRALRIENESLRAEMRGMQSPARILSEARAMGMEPSTDIKLVTVPTPKRVAAGTRSLP